MVVSKTARKADQYLVTRMLLEIVLNLTLVDQTLQKSCTS